MFTHSLYQSTAMERRSLAWLYHHRSAIWHSGNHLQGDNLFHVFYIIFYNNEQVGTVKDLSHLGTSLKEQFAEKHIPEKVKFTSLKKYLLHSHLTQVSYSLYHLLVDLLQFAASHLRWNDLDLDLFLIELFIFLGRVAGWCTGFQWLGRSIALASPPPTPALDWLKTVNRFLIQMNNQSVTLVQVLSSHSSRRLIVMERKPGEVKLNSFTQNNCFRLMEL